MKAPVSGPVVKTALALTTFLAGMLLAAPILAAVDRPASIEASGEGAVFDVKATADGTLKVGTKAGRAGDRWRVTIGEVNTGAVTVSAVGNGSSSGFSGFASRAVVKDKQYVVLVTWDRPLPGAFPASLTVRFDGASPPVVPVAGGSLSSIAARPIRWPEPPASCPGDGSAIGCEALVACAFDPAGDTDTFKVNVPANSDLSINIAGPSTSRWRLYAPNGSPINSYCQGQCEVALTEAGTYTVETFNYFNNAGKYQLSLLGVSTPFRCGPRAVPGGSPFKGQFELVGDTDSYQLNGVLANQVYSINCTGPSTTRWRIFDPDGSPINSYCQGSCQVKLPKAGGYTIKIFNYFNTPGAYTCSVQRVGG
jgi:hypothetical protein